MNRSGRGTLAVRAFARADPGRCASRGAATRLGGVSRGLTLDAARQGEQPRGSGSVARAPDSVGAGSARSSGRKPSSLSVKTCLDSSIGGCKWLRWVRTFFAGVIGWHFSAAELREGRGAGPGFSVGGRRAGESLGVVAVGEALVVGCNSGHGAELQGIERAG